MERLTEWDEFGNADIIALSDMMPEIYAELSFSETNALTEALNRLAAYEDTGLEPKQAMLISNVLREVGETYNCWFDYVVNCVLENSHLKDLAQAEKDGRLVMLPFVAMVEQSLQNGKMTPKQDQRFNERYAVVYVDKKKWASPLIDICGRHYDREEAEKRLAELTREEAEAAPKKREADNETD